MQIKGLVLNDIHFGLPDSKRIKDELHQFTDFLKEKKDEIDLVVFAGDFFNSEISMNSSSAVIAISFFKELLDICKENNIKLRFIKGTDSHEKNQISLFYPFIGETDFKIFETATEEETLPGFKVLYVPEEYPEDGEEFYKEFKQKEYSAMFGHGTWDFVAFTSQIEHGKRKDVNSAPVFIYEEWENALKDGFSIFGHIHSRHKYKNKIFYSGSFSRWNFADRSERGFSYFEYDIETKKYKVEFIDNIEAPTFEVFNLAETIPNYLDFEFEDLAQIVQVEVESSDFIVLNLRGLDLNKIELFKAKYKGNPNVQIEYEKKVFLKENTEEEKEFQKFQYIIKHELPLPETILRYVKEEFGKDLDLETIKGVIYGGK